MGLRFDFGQSEAILSHVVRFRCFHGSVSKEASEMDPPTGL